MGITKNPWYDYCPSPFRYPGGKSHNRKRIIPHIADHSEYREPFVGGGSIFFSKKKSESSWLNDKYGDLANTYTIIRDCPEELLRILPLDSEPTKDYHAYWRDEFSPSNDVERAARWFFLNRTSYSGIVTSNKCYWGYQTQRSLSPSDWSKRIMRCHKKLQGVKITSMDFEPVILSSPSNTFLFIDPPYFNGRQDQMYEHSLSIFDHIRLSEVLRKLSLINRSSRFLLTYNNDPEIWDLYSWAYVTPVDLDYRMGRTDVRNSHNLGKEIFITNYQI